VTDKEFLDTFYENNPDLRGKLQFSGTEAISILGFTNTSQLKGKVQDGTLRAQRYGRRLMYNAKDIIKLSMKKSRKAKTQIA
jgi:hypothetical protein